MFLADFLTDMEIFGFQSWAPKGSNIANYVKRSAKNLKLKKLSN